MTHMKKSLTTLLIACVLTGILFLGSGVFSSSYASAQSATAAQSKQTLKPTAIYPPGCPNAQVLQSNVLAVTHDGRSALLWTFLWGWFTPKTGGKAIYCHQAYCETIIHGEFVSGYLGAYCNYGSGETVYRIGGTAPGKTGTQRLPSQQVTNQAAPGTYFWAVATYQPYDSSTKFLISTNHLYRLPSSI